MYKPQDVLDDPGIRGAGSFVEMEFPGLAQPAPLVSPIAALSETPAAYVAAAPVLGRDTEALLRALGYSSGEIERLAKNGVVQTGQVAE